VGDALVTPEAAEMYRLTDSHEKLPMVVHQLLGGDGFFDHPERVARGEVHDGNVSDRLRGGTMKMFMDPVFPSSARIRFHLDGTEERFGERYYTQEEANQIVLNAHKSGFQVAIHCLGTWSIEQALTAFEYALREHPHPEPRFRIEHFSMPTAEQIKRTKSLGVIPTVQPPFILGADNAAARAEELGGVAKVHPYRTMTDEGVTIAASSDCPCAPLNPMLGMWAMVTRHTRTGSTIVPEEAVSPMEGLRMYTRNAAYAMHREGEVGSLEPGKRADMVVLSHDPTSVGTEFLRDIVVERTYVEGQLLYEC
jgi:predicted amidohydrolase YtcJ